MQGYPMENIDGLNKFKALNKKYIILENNPFMAFGSYGCFLKVTFTNTQDKC